MANRIKFPEGHRFFTLAELEALGLTRYMIDKLANDGPLVRLSDGIYELVHYGGLEDGSALKGIPSPQGNALTSFMPSRIGLDTRGMDRSLVHFTIPECPDSLQLVQIGVQTTLLYNPSSILRDYQQVHFLLAGKAYFTVDGRRFEAGAGQIVYLPMGVEHYFVYDETDPAQFVWMGFCGSLAKRLLDSVDLNEENLVADSADLQAVKLLAGQLAETIGVDPSYIALMPVFWRFVQELMKVKGYSPMSKRTVKSASPKDMDSRIAGIIQYIEREYMRDIVVADLAAEMDVSRAWLSRKFKELTGKTIKEYVTDMRISHAKEYLSRADCSIAEVAVRCGYDNPLFFSRMFKRKTGVSPSEWKKTLSSRK